MSDDQPARLTRAEHLDWCKRRAKEYMMRGKTQEALVSMFSDLEKHDETRGHPAISLGVQLMMIDQLADPTKAWLFIEGFN